MSMPPVTAPARLSRHLAFSEVLAMLKELDTCFEI